MTQTNSTRKRKRPIAVTFVGAIAFLGFLISAASGALDIWNSGMIQSGFQLPLFDGMALSGAGGQFLGGIYLGLAGLAALIIGIGALRMKRWAWIAFMGWSIFILVNQLIRYRTGVPSYYAMAFATFIVLALNQAEVQIAFGIKRDEYVQLESASNNPLDSE